MAALDIEAIAAQIHQFYLDQSRAEGWPNDFPMPYAELPEFMKADNRAAARRIGEVLALVGLRLVPRDGVPWPDEEQAEIRQLIEENLERLAEGEHDGWVEARLRQGWRLGLRKDIEMREHHLLVPWPQFPEQVKRKLEAEGKPADVPHVLAEVERERKKDRDSVLNYVRIIAQTDYPIVREERAAPEAAQPTGSPGAALQPDPEAVPPAVDQSIETSRPSSVER